MRTLTLISATLLTLVACSPSQTEEEWTDDGEVQAPSKDDVRKVLQGWFDDHPQCTPFFEMPHDVPVDAEYSRKQAQAFIDAGLLRQEGEVSIADLASGSGERRVIRYVATAEGEKQFRPGSGALADQKNMICYGTRKVEGVEVGEPDMLGNRVSVTYRYRLTDVPTWARSPSVRAFYPVFEEWLGREEEDHESLIHEDGEWKLERAPTSGMFDFRQPGR